MSSVSADSATRAADLFSQMGIDAASRKGGKSGETNDAASMKNTFFTMLTAQMQNQDPLDPEKNKDITSQLAQLSSVDALERLNKMLERLLASAETTQGLQAASLVGRGVLAPGNDMSLSGGRGGFGLELKSPVDKAVVTISDANNIVIRTLDLGALDSGVRAFAWDGKNDAGAEVADGKYKVSVKGERDGKAVGVEMLTAVKVDGLLRTAGGVLLEAGGARYRLDEVKGVV